MADRLRTAHHQERSRNIRAIFFDRSLHVSPLPPFSINPSHRLREYGFFIYHADKYSRKDTDAFLFHGEKENKDGGKKFTNLPPLFVSLSVTYFAQINVCRYGEK